MNKSNNRIQEIVTEYSADREHLTEQEAVTRLATALAASEAALAAQVAPIAMLRETVRREMSLAHQLGNHGTPDWVTCPAPICVAARAVLDASRGVEVLA